MYMYHLHSLFTLSHIILHSPLSTLGLHHKVTYKSYIYIIYIYLVSTLVYDYVLYTMCACHSNKKFD